MLFTSGWYVKNALKLLGDLESGLSALAFRTGALAIPDVRSVCPVNMTAVTASELINFLPAVRAGLSCIPNHNLTVGVNVANFRRAFWCAHGYGRVITGAGRTTAGC